MYAYPQHQRASARADAGPPGVLYLDMPIQHIHGDMLKRMDGTTRQDPLILHRLGQEVPGLTMGPASSSATR